MLVLVAESHIASMTWDYKVNFERSGSSITGFAIFCYGRDIPIGTGMGLSNKLLRNLIVGWKREPRSSLGSEQIPRRIC
jgi:galactokinase